MLRYLLPLLSCCIALACYVLPAFSDAPEGKQQGLISAIDLKDEDNPNSYKLVQDRTIKKVEELSKQLVRASEGSTSKFKNFDGYELNYIAASYLHCSIKTGACPFVLQSLLEADLINSAVDQSASCPNLKGFWKRWISSDMEKRMGYELGVGQFSKAQYFNKTTRPMFLNCEDTIKSILEKTPSTSKLFIERYGESSPQKKSVDKTIKLLKLIQKKVPNIFYKTKTQS